MTVSVFLDWFGVLADSEEMAERWRKIEAHLLQNLYGGSLSTWIAVHDRAFKWHLNYWARSGPGSHRNYREFWKQGEVEWIRHTLTWGGVEPPTSERELFRLNRKLTYEITRRINVAYPYTQRALESLKRKRAKLFLASGADSTYINGALEATGFGRYFEQTFSPDKLDAFKGSLRYWKKIMKLSKADPKSSVVADDRAKFLSVPTKLGLAPLLVDRDGASSHQTGRVRNLQELVSVVSAKS